MEGGDATPRRCHALLLPYPSQGHINPMLQFAKRLTHHGVDATLAITRFILNSTHPEPGPVSLAPVSDGFDHGGFAQAGDVDLYLNRLESVGSETLAGLIETFQAEGRPVGILVYDAFLPWGLDAARRFGVKGAAFFTQSCAVEAVYGHVSQGGLTMPAAEEGVSLPGLPRGLKPRDLPSFVTADVGYPAYMMLVLNQFRNLDQCDVLLVNSFYELEPEETEWLKLHWPVKTIGPVIPPSYLDTRFPLDKHYGFHLYAPDAGSCIPWLDSKPPNSVVYVSFGSMVTLGDEQMGELAWGLKASGKNFLLVIRESEASKFPSNFIKDEQGLVVFWCPQLEILAHKAIGCFFTHCGWNSTLEGLSLGVPMVGFPQWTDQPTDAKYVEDVWRVGVRVKLDDKGILRRGEVERCVREVMEGARSKEIRVNSSKWREAAKEAVCEGGSSDRNVVEFIDKYCA